MSEERVHISKSMHITYRVTLKHPTLREFREAVEKLTELMGEYADGRETISHDNNNYGQHILVARAERHE